MTALEPTTMSLSQSLAKRLPDLPRWVEARALLLGGACEIHGLREEPELSFVVRGPDVEEVFVVGAPADAAILAATERNVRGGMVIALPDQAERIARLLPEWSRSRAVLHLLGDSPRFPDVPPGRVRFLDPALLPHLPVTPELLRDLEIGAEGSPIAATFVDGEPVSFCYAGAITESLWDIAIDTLPGHRRRGYAALCVTHMIHHLQAQGKQPVWGAVDENPASWRLARKLGFVPVDELVLFEPRERPESPADDPASSAA
jgi:RimJ/RimL family protein N-acetyltransferase